MNRDFRDLLSALSDHEVRCLVVGGYAVAFHGRPRYTKDLDVWVDPKPENAERVWKALAAFGAPLTGVTPADFATPGTFVQIGVPPNRVDIITAVAGVTFAEAWSRRVSADFQGTSISYLALDDLIANKRAVARPQDLVDVEFLERVRLASRRPAKAARKRARRRQPVRKRRPR